MGEEDPLGKSTQAAELQKSQSAGQDGRGEQSALAHLSPSKG